MVSRKVCMEVIKYYNRAVRPIHGRNIIVVKGDQVTDLITGEQADLRSACRAMICVARKAHRQFYGDNALRKKWHDVLYHQWQFFAFDGKEEERLRNENLRPSFQRKESPRGLFRVRKGRASIAVHTR